MGHATREHFVQTLAATLAVLDDAGADYLLIGGLATAVVLQQAWDPAEDIDLLIRRDDADGLLARFADAGYATERHDPGWLYKAARPNVTVDLMFRAGERILLDDEHLARAVRAQFEGVPVRMPDPADLIVMKALFDSVTRPVNWHECVRLVRRGRFDWDYLLRRSCEHGPARMLSLLLYAATDGIEVPRRALTELGRAALIA